MTLPVVNRSPRFRLSRKLRAVHRGRRRRRFHGSIILLVVALFLAAVFDASARGDEAAARAFDRATALEEPRLAIEESRNRDASCGPLILVRNEPRSDAFSARLALRRGTVRDGRQAHRTFARQALAPGAGDSSPDCD